MTCCWQNGVQRSFFEMFSNFTRLYGTIDILQPHPFWCLRLLPKIFFYNGKNVNMQRREASMWMLIQIRFLRKKYLKITILVFWSHIVQTRIRIIIKIIFGRLMRISVRAHCRCIHLFPNRAHDASKNNVCNIQLYFSTLNFGIKFFVFVFWIDVF